MEGAAVPIESGSDPILSDRAAAFAEFLRSLGHRVMWSSGGWWYDAARRALLAVPVHRPLAPTDGEIRKLLRASGAMALRYVSAPGAGGKPSYILACRRRDYDLSLLGGGTRSKVRRGLRRCEVRRVEFREIARAGRPIDEETVRRQGRASRHGARWTEFWEAAERTPGMEGWGAFSQGELVAYLVTMDFGDAVDLMLARSRRAAAAAYPNNALVYTVTCEMLGVRGVPMVTFGLESLEPTGPLDAFKLAMGFEKVSVGQRVVLHPALAAVLRVPGVVPLVRLLGRSKGPVGERWRKVAGMLRFVDEGEAGGVPCAGAMRR